MMRIPLVSASYTFLCILSLNSHVLHISAQNPQNSKRGVAYLGDTYQSDNSLLLSTSSSLSWYYNWSPYPQTAQIPADRLEFAPLIHGINEAEDPETASRINSLPQSSSHLLTFNEPDGTNDSGGSSISPEDAAKAYIQHLAPYRKGPRTWNISHPSTTGSGDGLDWLRRFNSSCYSIDKENGCPIDFIAAHWYGNFEGLASWIGTLNEFYNTNRSSNSQKLKIWITEMALPQADADTTAAMMTQTLPYLDGLDFVERYAWFGAFRTKNANKWTGDGVALFDGSGGLTKAGALYLGGKEKGFEVGEKGSDGVSRLAGVNWRLTSVLLGAIYISQFC